MKKGFLIKALSRLIPLVLFWDLLSVILEHGFKTPGLLLAGFSNVYEAILSLLFYASAFSAIITVVTGSPTLYVLTLVLMVISKYHISPVVPVTSIVGLYAMLALDIIGFTYRENQGRSLKYGSLMVLVGALTLSSVLILVYALPSVLTGYFLLQIVSILHSSPSHIARVLAENVAFKLLLISCISALVYTLLSHLTEVIAVLAYPSRKTALKILANTGDINIIYKAPLESAKVLIVVSFIAPLLYVVLLDYVFPLILSLLRVALPLKLVNLLELWWFKPVIAIVVLVASWSLVGRLVTFYEELKLKGAFIISLLIAIVVYSVAVYYRFHATGNLLQAIINPDFNFLEPGVRRVYHDYYVNFIYLLEAVSALVGFAP